MVKQFSNMHKVTIVLLSLMDDGIELVIGVSKYREI